MNVFENEKQAKDHVGNTYGFIADNLRRLTEFKWVSAELLITPFMVKKTMWESWLFKVHQYNSFS